MNFLMGIASGVVTSLLATFVVAYFKLLAKTKKERAERKDNQNDLLLGLARVTLLDKLDRALERGYTTQSEYDVIRALYQPYTANGGNGTIQHLFEDRYNALKVREG